MIRTMTRTRLFTFALAALLTSAASADPIPQASYQWQNVSMGGGGAVTGIVLHPQVPDLAYIRTDVGGAYRWDSGNQTWIPLLDHIAPAEWNLYGVDSIAIDPNDASGNTLYISTGKYTADWAPPPGMLMKSLDRGRTWTRLPLSPTGGSNQDQPFGERLAVDPANSSHVLYAARTGTLHQSTDAGQSWRALTTIPQTVADPKERGNGLAFVLFDSSSGLTADRNATRVLYLGTSRHGVHRSDDAGRTWQRMPNSPERPIRAAIARDGTLAVSHSAGVALFDHGQWRNISPPTKDKNNPQGGAVAIDPANPRRILAAIGGGHGMQLWLTHDAGATWTLTNGQRNQTRTWWPDWHWFSAISAVAFDPAHPGRAWATDWYGVYSTPDVASAQPIWTNLVTGIEETVTTGPMVAPPSGPIRLFSCIADIGGLDHDSLDQPPARSIWSKGLTFGLTRTGIAISKARPGFVVTVGIRDWDKPGTGGYSLDSGTTWIPFKTKPFDAIKGGRVAITNAGKRILWAPQRSRLFYSDDLGTTWHPSQGPNELSHVAEGNGVFVYDQPLAVDTDDRRVYAYSQRKLFVSTDAGATFTLLTDNLPDHWKRKLISGDLPGHLWLATGDAGLHHSTDGGKSFRKIPTVQHAELIGTGKPAPGTTQPTLFIMGKIHNQPGFFRSINAGESWSQIDSPAQRLGNDPNTLTGDPQVFGGVFIGTNGRGIYYGQPTPMNPVTSR